MITTRGETARRRRRTAVPPASLPDDDDLLREILLRLPPRPSSLPRASLVCKRWRSLVGDPQFQRRFRNHHRKQPPLLGFFLDDYKPSCPFVPMLDGPDRIPSDRFSAPQGYNIKDCRHGLVLLHSSREIRLIVWDPVAREQHRITLPPELDKVLIFKGAVLRPAGARHFQVALVARYFGPDTRVVACLYSSEMGTWSNIISLPLQSFMTTLEPCTLIGNSICCFLEIVHDLHLLDPHPYVILEFDLDRQSLAVTELPPHIKPGYRNLRIMPAEDGGLGFIHLSDSEFVAQLWKRKLDSDGLSVWVVDRAIEFKELNLTYKRCSVIVYLAGFAEESNAILLMIDSGFFMLYLQPMEFKKLSDIRGCYCHYPFECCYAAGTGIGDLHGEDEVNKM